MASSVPDLCPRIHGKTVPGRGAPSRTYVLMTNRETASFASSFRDFMELCSVRSLVQHSAALSWTCGASQFPSHPGKEAGRMRVQRFRFFCKSLALLSVIGTGFHRTCCKS